MADNWAPRITEDIWAPSHHAINDPDRPAVILAATGQTVSYGKLELRSLQLSRALRHLGLEPGAHVAILMDHRPELFEILWAAQRAGVHFTPISNRFTVEEVSYILNDSGAQLLFVSDTYAKVAIESAPLTPGVNHRVLVGEPLDGYIDYETLIRGDHDNVESAELEGAVMLYSSGTTGRPKGIKRTMKGSSFGSEFGHRYIMCKLMKFTDSSRYLSTAPLYHAAPLSFLMGCHRIGATVFVMGRFEPETVLDLIDTHQLTHAQFVPTMFVRMLKLPEETRSRYSLKSLVAVVHSAAPCPIEIKKAMLAWWGPIICEYYAGTERNGVTYVDAIDWLAHPGTVGKPIYGQIHIVDPGGVEVGPGQTGLVYFSGGDTIEYHNDPQKTQKALDHRGWSTLGDIGHVDADGFLYLTDRSDFVIIRGGVNIYPQEVEDRLILHSQVSDVAVIGIPDEEMGQQVKAFVEPVDPTVDHEELCSTLISYCRAHLATYKCPSSIEIVINVPRRENGKLYKKALQSHGDVATGQTNSGKQHA